MLLEQTHIALLIRYFQIESNEHMNKLRIILVSLSVTYYLMLILYLFSEI